MSNTAANPTGVTSTPTGGTSSGAGVMLQQFIVWSPDLGPPAQSPAAWNSYMAQIPASGQNVT